MQREKLRGPAINDRPHGAFAVSARHQNYMIVITRL